MSWWLKPLSRKADALLAQERELEAAPAEVRTRALAKARTAHRQVDAFEARTSPRRRPAFVWAAVVLALATVSFAAWRNWAKPEKRAPAVTQPAPSSATQASDRAPLPLPNAEPTSPELPRTPQPDPLEKREAAPAPSSVSGADAYALELEILGRARAAAASGDFAAALRAIATHQRRFPSGRLLEEREALRVKALSGLGRVEEARRAAERFRERFPRSVLAQPQ